MLVRLSTSDALIRHLPIIITSARNAVCTLQNQMESLSSLSADYFVFLKFFGGHCQSEHKEKLAACNLPLCSVHSVDIDLF